jgi:hypothetical protein
VACVRRDRGCRRICAKYRSDFGLVHTQIGVYFHKSDGSNSNPFGELHTPAQVAAYEKVSAMIETRRRITQLSPEVQSDNGIALTEPRMTIRQFLNRIGGA